MTPDTEWENMDISQNDVLQAEILSDTTTEYKGDVGATIDTTPDTEECGCDEHECCSQHLSKNEWRNKFAEILTIGDSGDIDFEASGEKIQALLSSRDTYWKERVVALRKELWHDYHNAQKWSEQKAVADALDTLLDNLK